jgi:hypothetical protein
MLKAPHRGVGIVIAVAVKGGVVAERSKEFVFRIQRAGVGRRMTVY